MIEDRFHIGSDTKAMTALIAAMLVEAGKIRWTSTVGEVFPELAATMDPAVKGVTLEQLLSHISGIPSDTDAGEKLVQQSFTQEKLNLDELRSWVVKQLVTRPLHPPTGHAVRLRQHGLPARRGHARTRHRPNLGGAHRGARVRPLAAENSRARATVDAGPGRCPAWA